ncbi:MAG: hypothetical protein P1U89_05030 [Verrucomicrobiales bacterium]|nr:hypothetical protein [Verrucomicrobiales bacterium]
MTGPLSMDEQLLTLLHKAREEDDAEARLELNSLLRNDPEARRIMAMLLVDEQAIINHLRDDSIVSILDPNRKNIKAPARNRLPLLPVGAAVAVGLILGMVGMSVAFGYARPKSIVTPIPVAHGDFDSLPLEPIERGFSSSFGQWSGDPANVIEDADGNRRLRFMATGNVKGDPNGGASACNAFQFIDLTNLRVQRQIAEPASQSTLELSVQFDREPDSAIDKEFPKLKSGCSIYLFETDPGTVIEGWPHILSDAVAIGRKNVRIKRGEKSVKVTATCILEPEATVALITLDVGGIGSRKTPVELGNYYADDVRLTLATHPKLPVRIEK